MAPKNTQKYAIFRQKYSSIFVRPFSPSPGRGSHFFNTLTLNLKMTHGPMSVPPTSKILANPIMVPTIEEQSELHSRVAMIFAGEVSMQVSK